MKKLIKSLSVLSVSALYLVSSFSLFSCNKFVLSLPKIDSSSYKYEITSHFINLTSGSIADGKILSFTDEEDKFIIDTYNKIADGSYRVNKPKTGLVGGEVSNYFFDLYNGDEHILTIKFGRIYFDITFTYYPSNTITVVDDTDPLLTLRAFIGDSLKIAKPNKVEIKIK